MNSVVIVSAARTAIGKFGGSLKDFSPGQLGYIVLKDALRRADVQPDEVGEVIMGNVLSDGQGMNIARQSGLEGKVALVTGGSRVNIYEINEIVVS